MTEGSEAINYSDVLRSAKLLDGKAVRTPLIENQAISEQAGRRVLVKAECLQHTGSFKFRGAWSALSQLDTGSASRGVITYSSGNHAQGIAMAARMLGISATIVMPADAPSLKLSNTRDLGAKVVLYDRAAGESREDLGAELAADGDLTLVKPYDNAHVMAGQGTVGLEIAEQADEIGISDAEVLVCCGGGGLTSGIAIALERDAPSFVVRPVEPEAGDDVARSLKSGKREFNSTVPKSICDAIVTPSPGILTFPILKRLCGAGMTVSDNQALAAMAVAATRLKLVAEPGGAVALAAGISSDSSIRSDTVICVISGGNVDPRVLAQALALGG